MRTMRRLVAVAICCAARLTWGQYTSELEALNSIVDSVETISERVAATGPIVMEVGALRSDVSAMSAELSSDLDEVVYMVDSAGDLVYSGIGALGDAMAYHAALLLMKCAPPLSRK